MRSLLSVKTIKPITGAITIADGIVRVGDSVFPIQDVVSIIDGTAYVRMTCVLGGIAQSFISDEGFPVYVLNTGVQVVAVDPSAHVTAQIHPSLIAAEPVAEATEAAEPEAKPVEAQEPKKAEKKTRRRAPRKAVTKTAEKPVAEKPVQATVVEKPAEDKSVPSTYETLGAGVVAAALGASAQAEEPVEAEKEFALEPTDEEGLDEELPAPIPEEDNAVIAKAEAAVEDAGDTLAVAEDTDFEPLDSFETVSKLETTYNQDGNLFDGLPEDDTVSSEDALAPEHRGEDESSELEVEDEDLVEERYDLEDDDLYNFDEDDN